MSGGLRVVALILALLAPEAGALTVDGATVTLGGRRGDVFQVKGRFDPAVVDPAAGVAFTLAHVTVVVPASDFSRRKNVFTHRGGKTPGALSLLRLDVGKGRFVAAGTGWGLAGAASPYAIRVGADCGRAVVRGGRKRAGTRGTQKLAQRAKDRAPGGCGLGAPRAVPIVVRTGIATTVDVEVDASGAPGATALQLRRADVAEPACALSPLEGDPAGRVGCTITVDEAQPTTLSLFAEGTLGGARVVSEGVALPVKPPPTAADLAAVGTANDEAGRLWGDARTRLGDTLAARMETIAALRATPGIADATLGPDGLEILLRYTTGWQGVLLVNRPDVEASIAPATAQTNVADTGGVTNGIFRSCPDAPEGETCCPIDRRVVLKNRKVLLWQPGFSFKRGTPDDTAVVEKLLGDHACLGLEVTRVSGAAADLASLATFTSYSTVVVSTHGALDESRRVGICTGQEYDAAAPPDQADLDRGFIRIGVDVEPTDEGYRTRDILCASEDYVARLGGTFAEPAIVYASHCHSGAGRMPDVYLAKGAGRYIGFGITVHITYTSGTVTPQLFTALLKDLRDADQAFDGISPKIDPFLGGPVRAFASTTRHPAYAGLPTLTSNEEDIYGGETATLTLDVEGKGTCELRGHWHAGGEFGTIFGDLVGGNDIPETTDTTHEFTAKQPGGGKGTDGVSVEVFPPDGDQPIGVACGGVFVVGSCPDGIRQAEYGEECDNLDGTSASCPTCSPTCTCNP